MTMKVTPGLQQQILKKSYTEERPKEIMVKPPEPREDSAQPFLSKINETQKKKYGSPTNQAKKLVPLSKKFSAYPVSDARKAEASCNDANDISINSGPGPSSVQNQSNEENLRKHMLSSSYPHEQ